MQAKVQKQYFNFKFNSDVLQRQYVEIVYIPARGKIYNCVLPYSFFIHRFPQVKDYLTSAAFTYDFIYSPDFDFSICDIDSLFKFVKKTDYHCFFDIIKR